MKDVLTTLDEEDKQRPLPPQVLKTLKQRIEFLAESNAEDGAIIDKRLSAGRQPPTADAGPVDSHAPLSYLTKLVSHQTPNSKADKGDSRKRAGDILNDRYEIVEQIATGVMSVLYKAIDRHTANAEDRDNYVTVKILKRRFKAQEESLLALQQEVVKAQRLEHPNIVKLYGFDQDGDTAYLIMEHFLGEPLNQRIGPGGLNQMSHRERLRITNEMGKAFSYAHDLGVMHCDFKPASVFLSDNGDVKVLFFSLARALYLAAKKDGQQKQGRPRMFSGSTPAYVSPEMLESCEPDPRQDVFSLACTSYELLTGEHPFQRMRASTARDAELKVKRRGELTRVQWQAFQAALEFNRNIRTRTVDAFLAALNAAERRSRVYFIATAAGIAGAVVFTFFMMGSNDHVEHSRTPQQYEFSKFEMADKPADPVKEQQSNQSPAISNRQIAALQMRLADIKGQRGRLALERETGSQPAQQEPRRIKEQVEALKQTNRKAAKTGSSETQQAGHHVAMLLALAKKQFAAKRLTLPAGNNALETYQQVLQEFPEHKGALMGIDRIKSEYQKWASDAKKAGNLQRALVNLEKAFEVDPQDAALTEALRVLKQSIKTAEQEARLAGQDDTERQTPATGEQTVVLSDNVDSSPQASTTGEPAQTRSETVKPEQDKPARQGRHRIRSYGSFF